MSQEQAMMSGPILLVMVHGERGQCADMADKERTFQIEQGEMQQKWWTIIAGNIEQLRDAKKIAKSEVLALLHQNGYRFLGERQMRRILAGTFCPRDADALIWAFAAIFANRDDRELPMDQKQREYHRKITENTSPQYLMAARDSKTEFGDSNLNSFAISEHKPTWDAVLGSTSISPLVQKALFHDEEADAYRARKHQEYHQAKSYGRIFEIRNWILSHTPLEANGLSPTEIIVEPPAQEFTKFDPKIIDEQTVNRLTEAGKHNPNDNGTKVSLVGLFPPDISDENPRAVRLKTARSDYYSNMGALATIRRDRLTRHENMSLGPEDHRIPNAMSIHYIIRFSDRKFLASHRSKTLAYDPERVSFSGNEQLKPEDFVNERPLERVMSRAVLEEVFPMRDFAMEAPEVAEALSLVAFGRYLSLYLEEKVGNFGLVCFIQFKTTSDQFAGKYYGRQLGARFRRDREGEPYLLTEKELSRFFQTGKCDFKGLMNDKRLLSVAVDGLEAEGTEGLWRLDSSSLYRMWLAGQLVGVLQS